MFYKRGGTSASFFLVCFSFSAPVAHMWMSEVNFMKSFSPYFFQVGFGV